MASTTAQKLKIKEGNILTMNAPADYKKSLGPLPTSAKIIDSGKSFNQVHWFVKDKAQMEKELKKVLPLIKDDVICCIFYPKGTSKIQTDLTRDKGWDELRKHDMQWISLISFDDTWSVFGIREKTTGDRKKEMKQPETREVFKWVDPVSKKITLPDEMAKVLKKHKKEMAQFESLSFTNRKEYVEWIVTAKREDTRQARLSGMIERLGKGWKNPSNR